MSILDQSRTMGSMSAPVVPAELAAGEVILLPAQTAAAQFAEYQLLNDAAASLAPYEGPAAEHLRTDVGVWLDGRTMREGVQPKAEEPDPTEVAFGRMGELLGELRQVRALPVREFDLDASEALLDAAYTHRQEVAVGGATAAFPDLGDDPVRALPILRYVPEDRRHELLAGLPEPLANLAPAPAENQEPQHPTGFWNRARDLGSRVLDRLHWRRRTQQAVGQAALAAEVAVEPETVRQGAELSAKSAPERTFVASNGEQLRLVSFWDINDPAYADLTRQAVDGRLAEYQNHGLLKEGAAKDEIRGSHVEILTVVNEAGEVVASLRKIHGNGLDLDRLPSYHKFIAENAFSDDGRDLLHAHTTGDRDVVEIAALWKKDEYDTDVKIELYKNALQTSMERDELWFMGIVQAEYAGLLRSYGKHVVHTLGTPVEVKGEGATDKVRLRPVMVEPRTFYTDMVAEMRDASAAGDRRRMTLRGLLLGEFLIGVNWAILDGQTRSAVEGAFRGVYN